MEDRNNTNRLSRNVLTINGPCDEITADAADSSPLFSHYSFITYATPLLAKRSFTKMKNS